VAHRAQARREQPPRGAVADPQRGCDLGDRAARDPRQRDGLALGAPHAREGRGWRPAHRAQHGAAHELGLRRVARRAAQDGGRHLLGDDAVAAGGQCGAPDGVEVVPDHGATLRQATGPVIDRKAESRGQASGPRQATAKAIG
jgi:hypothetical protein